MDQEKTETITLETIDDINGSALPYNLLLAEKAEIKDSDQSKKITKFYVDKVIKVPVRVRPFRKSIVRIKG